MAESDTPAAESAGSETDGDPSALLLSRGFIAVLLIAAVVGVIVSLAAWCFVELIYQIQQELYHHLPSAVGYPHGPPLWWSLPILALAGLITAAAIVRLPGGGGHIPAEGLKVGGGPTRPVELPGIALAALASIGLGAVIGPEAPLLALGAGTAVAIVKLARKDAASQLLVVVGAAGSFAALAFLFSSPIIAAVIVIEVSGLGRARLPVILLPGLTGAAIGSLVSIGMGSFTGLSDSAYALGPLPLPAFHRPTIGSFGWSIALALAVAVIAHLIRSGGLGTHRLVSRRPFLLLPLAGLIVSGVAIAFAQSSGRSVNEVLFDGQSALPGLVSGAGKWSLSALALLIVFKSIGYTISLGSFRGGPTFPAIFLGAAGGIMASHLAGFPLSAAVAVGMGTGTVAILQLPLSAIVIAALLTSKAGSGADPLTIVAVVVCYLVTLWLSALQSARAARGPAVAADAPPIAAHVAPKVT
ncbi:MAG TPA: chloride channel protein [Solirubrobacteraceae bacterium]|nr:chloride channel protein [Solirubrobacteraceae bacterium]